MLKKLKSSNLDTEPKIPFGPRNILLTQKEIDNHYIVRREVLLKGYCAKCCSYLERFGILKNHICPLCGINLEEYCFESSLKNREREIKSIFRIFKMILETNDHSCTKCSI